MKTDTIKKVVLGILVVIVVYIWYGNLQLFTSSEETYSAKRDRTTYDKQISNVTNVPKLAFQTPKVNPFAKPANKVPVANSQTVQSRPTATSRPSTPRPSSAFHLVGTLTQANIDFAALADTQGKQVLLQRGDSLNGWVTKRIRQEQLIFAQDRFRDTLRLVTIELQ